MRKNQPSLRHSGVWAVRLLEDLKEQGVPIAPILRRAGVSGSKLSVETPMLQFDEVVAIFQAAAQEAEDSSLAFHFSQRQDIRDAGMIAYVALSAPTLEDAVTCMSRYYRVFSDAVKFDLSELKSNGVFSWSYSAPISLKRRQLVEWSAAIFAMSAREATGRHLSFPMVTFRHPRKDGVSDFRKFFGGSVRFDAPGNAIQMRTADLALPVRSADHRLARVLRQCCEDALSRLGSQQSPFLARLEQEISERLSKGEAGVEDVARAMGLSRRTLSRRLGEFNTSYRDTLSNLRLALAERYLTDSDLSVSEIGFLLGYSDTASFSAAYRRWTGHTPKEARTK